jgi:carbon monoxide dehydrogenase subunit G
VKFQQQVVIPAAVDPLWDFLIDIPRVARSLPGVESVSQLDDSSYQGTLKVRVGPIALNLQGKIIVENRDKEKRQASLRVEASDRIAAGGVKGRTSMQLRELSPKETELQVETDVNILGKIGEFGQPVIRKKADTMLRQFVENIKKQLQERA